MDRETMIGIFRTADVPQNEAATLSPSDERYIALYFDQSRAMWETSETLFGLQDKLKHVFTIKWEEAEKQIQKSGFYKIPRSGA